MWRYGSAASSASTTATAALTEPPLDLQWWLAFDDPVLNRLIDRGFATNSNFRIAAIRLERARLQVGLAEQNRLPQLSASVGSNPSNDFSSGRFVHSYSATLGVAYEADLWNKLADRQRSAEFEATATAEDRLALAHTLAGQIADAYWQIGYLKRALQLSTDNLATASRTLSIVTAGRASGTASGLDLAQAQQTWHAQQATHTALEQQYTEAVTALAVLLGAAPEDDGGEVEMETSALAAVMFPSSESLPRVPAGIPAALLQRRPDLRAAEARLASAFYDTEATRAAMYPTLNLTATVGTASEALRDLLRNPVGTLGAIVAFPFLQYEINRLNIRVSETTYRELLETYRKTWLQSLADVENALSAQNRLALEADQLAQSLDYAQRAERLAEVRYRAGATAIAPWLDTQTTRRSAEQSLLQNRLNQLNNLAALNKALGGGWTLAE